MNAPITMTDKAAAQIDALLRKAPDGAQGVRLNVKSSGCSGNKYQMEYIESGQSLEADDVFTHGETKLYIPKTLSWMLFGLRVDYIVDELGSARFDFANPNESSRCGCGESFHVDVDELQRLQGVTHMQGQGTE